MKYFFLVIIVALAVTAYELWIASKCPNETAVPTLSGVECY